MGCLRVLIRFGGPDEIFFLHMEDSEILKSFSTDIYIMNGKLQIENVLKNN